MRTLTGLLCSLCPKTIAVYKIHCISQYLYPDSDPEIFPNLDPDPDSSLFR